jgi:hypothetical protein
LSIYNVLTKRIAHSIITIFRYITYLPKGQQTPLSPSAGILRIYQKDNTPHYHHFPVYYVFTKRTTHPIITIFRYITYLPKGQQTPLSPSAGILRIYQKDNIPHYHHFPVYYVFTKRTTYPIITIFYYITYFPKGQHTPLSPSSGILRIYQKDNTPHYHHLPVYYVLTKRTTHPIITIFRYITYLPKGQHTPLSPFSGILRIYQKYQHTKLDFYSANSPKQHSAGRHCH